MVRSLRPHAEGMRPATTLPQTGALESADALPWVSVSSMVHVLASLPPFSAEGTHMKLKMHG
jgi:hypothetical protein